MSRTRFALHALLLMPLACADSPASVDATPPAADGAAVDAASKDAASKDAGPADAAAADAGEEAAPAEAGPVADGGPDAGTCRSYPAAGTTDFELSGGTATTSFTGSFDPAALTLTTVYSASAFSLTTTLSYPSIDGFVDEAAAVGLTRYTEQAVSGIYTETLAYAGGRLASRTRDDGLVETYNTWDAEGRPTAGTLTSSKLSCAGATVSYVYDDQARTRQHTMAFSAGVGPDCPNEDVVTRSTFDAANFETKREESLSAGGTRVIFAQTAVSQAAEVCR